MLINATRQNTKVVLNTETNQFVPGYMIGLLASFEPAPGQIFNAVGDKALSLHTRIVKAMISVGHEVNFA